jgi:hypothetical protein
MTGFRIVLWAFFQAFGTLIYVITLTVLLSRRVGFFGQALKIGSSAFWLLALLSGAATLALLIDSPVRLHARGDWQDALYLFCFSIAWLVLFSIIALSGLIPLPA